MFSVNDGWKPNETDRLLLGRYDRLLGHSKHGNSGPLRALEVSESRLHKLYRQAAKLIEAESFGHVRTLLPWADLFGR